LKDLISSADTDGNGTIDFDELLALMESNTVRNTYLEEMKKAFRHFDQDGNGFISPLELRKALLRMKIRLSKVEFVLMLRRVDTDQDGQISFKEFVVMMLSDGV
jgi:Ca2+-binding EF-hand superfamily protein